jgi:penicillin V acylase-like amidase (Ntn superfamily)
MKANNINVLFVLFVVFVRPFSLEACTTFVLKRNNTILLAKNLDWPIADGVILVNKRGETKTSFFGDSGLFS